MVRALTFHQCGPGSIRTRVELVVGSPPAPRVFSGFPGFAPSTNTNISKFQLDQATLMSLKWLPSAVNVVIYLSDFAFTAGLHICNY